MKTILLFISVFLAAMASGQNTNCSGAVQICSNASFSGTGSGAGTQELTLSNQGCLSLKHQSWWYYFQAVTSGTVALSIESAGNYDFAIWPSGNCASLGTPVRCSSAPLTGNTGMAASYFGQTSLVGCGTLGLSPCYGTITVSDASESLLGDGWVTPLSVVSGQTYVMLIDNYAASSIPYSLTWTLSGGAVLNCTPFVLPIGLLDFMAAYDASANSNKVYWETETERLNDHFTLERSFDGSSWTTINQQPGAENSIHPLSYAYEDFSFAADGINYYRLSQTDYDGTTEQFSVITVDNRKSQKAVVKVFNMLGQELPPEALGIVILLYDDGTTRRVFR